ncbi:MAG: T9SS type A sorting domain-containing protein [Flavobacteriales bacterium]|nr:T9SS type A sorting domain-containing protein [Flavobacteriales bacterium]
MKWTSLFLVLFCWENSFAQSRYSGFFDLNNGAEGLLDAVLMENGNIQAVGSSLNLSDNVGRDDGFHVLVDEFGELIQSHGFSELNKSYSTRSIIKSEYSSSTYIAGYYCDFTVQSSGYCDYFLSKLNETGDTLYRRVYERRDTCDYLLDLVETRPNKIILIGWTCNDTVQNNNDLLFITVDTLGNELNRVVFGGGGTDYVNAGLTIDSDGHVIMVGYTKSFPSINSGRSWVVKTDSIGNVLWQKTYNGIGGSTANGIRAAMLPDGNIIISGGKSGNGYLQKIDTDGNEIWIKQYDVPGSQGLWGVVGLEDGTIVSCGVTDDGNGGSQAGWLIKTDGNGDTLWTRTYDSSSTVDYLRNMLVMANGDIVMVGFGRGENSTTQDGWILRVDSMGCLVEGCFSVGIDERTIDDKQFVIWPNPASNLIHIQSSMVNVQRVSVVDMLGRDCFSRSSFAMTDALDVSGWPDGIYLITVTDEDGNRFAERLVVQH